MRNRLWSYSPPHAVRGLNAVRVYERKPNGSIYVEWYDRDGRHQVALRTIAGGPVTDKKLAMRIADEMATAQAKVRNAEYGHELLGLPRPRTLRELFTAYEKAHPKWSTKHLKDQRLNQRFWEDRLGKDTLLTDVTPAKAAAVIRREMEVNDQFGERVQQKRVRYLKDAYTYARDHEKWITHQHDLAALEVPKVRGNSKPYTLAEVMRLLPATEKVDLRLAALSRIAFTTGRREAAIRTLPATAYSVEKIEGKSYGVLQFPADTDKARKSGKVVITGRTRELVEELLDTRAVRTSGWLFPSGDLDRDATTYISDQWMRDKLKEAEVLAKVENIPGRAFHALKRRFATQARKYDADAASKMSGTTSDTLEWYYVQDDLEPKAGLAEHMERLA